MMLDNAHGSRMLTVTLWTIWPADRFYARPTALCVGSVTYAAR